MIIVFSILGAVIIAMSAVMTAAAIMGRPLKVNSSRKLDGVNDDIQNALWYSSTMWRGKRFQFPAGCAW